MILCFFPGAANLKQQLSAMQQESEEEQQAFRRTVMKLREQLLQANRERDEAHAEVQRLRETVEAAAAAKVILYLTTVQTDSYVLLLSIILICNGDI